MPDSNSATSLLFFWLAVIELSRFIPPDIFDCCDCIECKWGGSDFKMRITLEPDYKVHVLSKTNWPYKGVIR